MTPRQRERKIEACGQARDRGHDEPEAGAYGSRGRFMNHAETAPILRRIARIGEDDMLKDERPGT